MSCSLRSTLTLLAVFAMIAGVHAVANPGHPPAHPPAMPAFHPPPAHHAGMPSFHPSPTHHAGMPSFYAGRPPHYRPPIQTNHYRRPIVYRMPVYRPQHYLILPVHRPATRTVARTTRRHPVHRVTQNSTHRLCSAHRNSGQHRRYAYNYYPGRYQWRTNHYNRGYGGRAQRQLPRGICGTVAGVQGTAGNGKVLVNLSHARSGRFRNATTAVSANSGPSAWTMQPFQVNNATRYEVMSTPVKAVDFASLHEGDQILILRQDNESNTAQKVEIFPRQEH